MRLLALELLLQLLLRLPGLVARVLAPERELDGLERHGLRRQQPQVLMGGRLPCGEQPLHVRAHRLPDVLVLAHVDGVLDRRDEDPCLLRERHDDGGQLDGDGFDEALGQIGAGREDLQHLQPHLLGEGEAGEFLGLHLGQVLLEEQALLAQTGLERGGMARQGRRGHGEHLVVPVPELLADERRGEGEGPGYRIGRGHGPGILCRSPLSRGWGKPILLRYAGGRRHSPRWRM
ncbi:hypothetical protein ACN28I_06650 [Archangium gephyra]|uniref:hypothetical protein n=1 Tax=Archangium gephyra TaxID=48 RepID=UPI003B80FE69